MDKEILVAFRKAGAGDWMLASLEPYDSLQAAWEDPGFRWSWKAWWLVYANPRWRPNKKAVNLALDLTLLAAQRAGLPDEAYSIVATCRVSWWREEPEPRAAYTSILTQHQDNDAWRCVARATMARLRDECYLALNGPVDYGFISWEIATAMLLAYFPEAPFKEDT